jgi:DNA-binding CsgD family transcriptional regulator
MNDAFRAAYAPWTSPLGRVLGPVVHYRTYLRAAHLLLLFPLGIAYFTVLVTGFAVGGALIWTLAGPLVLIPLLFLTRWAGDSEAWLVRRVARIELRRPPTRLERGLSARQQIWTRLIDPSTWTGIVYLFLQFAVGTAVFVALVALYAGCAAFIATPIIVAFSDSHVDLGSWTLDSIPEALLLVPLGLLGLVLTTHVVLAASALHAAWARLMLGSRARSLPADVEARPLPPEPTPPTDGSGLPVAAPTLAVAAAGTEPLTAREQEVLLLVARGYANAEIAEALVISEGTVKTHVKHIFAKIDVRDRTQAAAFAYDHGFVTPSPRVAAVEPTPLRARSG